MIYTPETAKTHLLERFEQCFGISSPEKKKQLVFGLAPGRVELAGNHTDHQGGRTISAAIDRRIYALAAPNGTDEIRVIMENFGEARIPLSCLDPQVSEQRTSTSLVRGMAAAYTQTGAILSGFDMVTCSDIPAGCGLSSSAAFEMLMGVTIRAVCDPYAPSPNPIELALEGMQVEDSYFGKPSGAQDQLASAFGGVSAFDFADDLPRVTPVAFDINASDYTDEFVSIPSDMYAVAHHFGCERLEDVPYEKFLDQLANLRTQISDQAILRALHYFEETRRVLAQQNALQEDNFEEFLTYVRQSGASSAQFLQNVSPRSDTTGADQPATIILALCAHLLHDKGAYRIHGGGFGGSVLSFVPRDDADSFSASMDALLGYPACLRVSTSTIGASAERLV